LDRLALEKIPIQELLDKNTADMNNLQADLDDFIVNRELIENNIISGAAKLEAQPRNVPDINKAEMLDLILGEMLQFLDINHCVRILDGT